MYLRQYQKLLKELRKAVQEVYGERLVSLVGRGTPRPNSDVDLLLIATDLPRGRVRRVREFELVEEKLEPVLERMRQDGIETFLSPVIKEPGDVLQGSLIFLDMLDDALILCDKDDFFRRFLADLKGRLEKLGAKKFRSGGAWYWVLKDDYKPGEEFEI